MTKDVMDALNYFHGAGFIEQLRTNEKHYVEILMNFAAKKLNVELA